MAYLLTFVVGFVLGAVVVARWEWIKGTVDNLLSK